MSPHMELSSPMTNKPLDHGRSLATVRRLLAQARSYPEQFLPITIDAIVLLRTSRSSPGASEARLPYISEYRPSCPSHSSAEVLPPGIRPGGLLPQNRGVFQ